MDRDDLKFNWWKQACEKSPNPISFVGLDDKFIFCNKSWCKLLGYSESELREVKWQNITKLEDIGSDEKEVSKIKSGEKEEYYLEKKYIRKDESYVEVKLYVHKYPEEGSHEGYIVFAERVTSQDYEDLKSKFLTLQSTVLLLEQSAVASDLMQKQVNILEQKIEQNKEITKMILNKSPNINIGDNISGDRSGNKAGRDNIIESNKVNIILIMLILVMMTVLVCFIGFWAAFKLNLLT